jgi:hypothetical protein
MPRAAWRVGSGMHPQSCGPHHDSARVAEANALKRVAGVEATAYRLPHCGTLVRWPWRYEVRTSLNDYNLLDLGM